MILDKLLEKKDMLIYIDKRIEYLRNERNKLIPTLRPRKRGLITERFKGRILELQLLKHNINNIKDSAKWYWSFIENLTETTNDE